MLTYAAVGEITGRLGGGDDSFEICYENGAK
jgi:hypothetical protein